MHQTERHLPGRQVYDPPNPGAPSFSLIWCIYYHMGPENLLTYMHAKTLIQQVEERKWDSY